MFSLLPIFSVRLSMSFINWSFLTNVTSVKVRNIHSFISSFSKMLRWRKSTFSLLKWCSLSSASHSLELLYLSSAQLLISLQSLEMALACRWTSEVAKEKIGIHFCLLLTDALEFGCQVSLRELLKEPTANASSHSTQRSQQASLLWEITHNDHVTSFLGSSSNWLSSFPAQTIVSLHPLHVVLIPNDIPLIVTEDQWFSTGKETRVNHSCSIWCFSCV